MDFNSLLLFSLVLMRMSGAIFFNPIFSRRDIPRLAQAGIVFVFSIVVFTGGQTGSFLIDANNIKMLEYAMLLIKELGVGYVLGFIVNLALYVIILGGEIIDNQIGLSMAKVFDPSSNASISISASFYNAVFLLLFFATDSHLNLIYIFIKSYEMVPYGEVVINGETASVVLDIFRECSVLGVKLAFPFLAAEFITEVSVGILMKTIPQINVFVINIQVKIALGIVLIFLLFSPMAEFLQTLTRIMFDFLTAGLLRL